MTYFSHYGWLANRVRQAKLSVCRVLLQQQASATPPMPSVPQTAPALGQPVAGCPLCQRGRMAWVDTLRRQPALVARWMQPLGGDTS